MKPTTVRRATPLTTSTAKKWTKDSARKEFLEFYEERNHKVVPGASLIPEDTSVLLTIAGMLPFKPVFTGERERPAPAAISSQRCVRTADIDNVGVTARHLTTFDMLGAFSFGDYFKEKAIGMAYRLLTEVYQLDEARLVITVLSGDEEAIDAWVKSGIDKGRIYEQSEEENFWAAGETGPRGACSEVLYDLEGGKGGNVDPTDGDRFLEVYNLVFIDRTRDKDGNETELERKCVDTGLGLERLLMVLESADTPFETDALKPIIDKMAEFTRVDAEAGALAQSETLQRNTRIVADHVRCAGRLLEEEIHFSNTGRGYVLRRLVRRALRAARSLGLKENAVPNLIELSLSVDDGDGEKKAQTAGRAKEWAENEKERFDKLLRRGEKPMRAKIGEAKAKGLLTLPGEDAFDLHDTHGVPYEVVEDCARAEGLAMDPDGFEDALQMQQKRARESLRHDSSAAGGAEQKGEGRMTAQEALQFLGGESKFVGYKRDEIDEARVTRCVVMEEDGNGKVTAMLEMEETPFYPEGGGQVADVGTITLENGVGSFSVTDTQRETSSNAIGHITETDTETLGAMQRKQEEGELKREREGGAGPATIDLDLRAKAKIDKEARWRATVHHTATHLLHASLLRRFGAGNLKQAGSLVDKAKLRFDFENGGEALGEEGASRLEEEINGWIQEEEETRVDKLSVENAISQGACFLDGEDYGRGEVRVVSVGNISKELCGGTHAPNSKHLSGFRITSEEAIGSGTRRVEAVAGPALCDLAIRRDKEQNEIAKVLNVSVDGVIDRVASLVDSNKQIERENSNLSSRLASVEGEHIANEAKAQAGGGLKFVHRQLDHLQGLARDAVFHAIGLHDGPLACAVTCCDGKKCSLVLGMNEKARENSQRGAGDIIKQMASEVGGGGGGKPSVAQAGVPAEAQEEAISLVRSCLQEG